MAFAGGFLLSVSRMHVGGARNGTKGVDCTKPGFSSYWTVEWLESVAFDTSLTIGRAGYRFVGFPPAYLPILLVKRA